MRAFASLLLLTTLACGDPFTPKGVAGTYNLKSINGANLPFGQTVSGITITITGGSITLNENGSFLSSVSGSATDGSLTIPLADTQGGTFALIKPNAVRMTYTDNTVDNATLEGNRLTILGGSDVVVFER